MPKDFDARTRTDPQKRRIENFLTEALALAIKTSWVPIGRALGDVIHLGEPREILAVSPTTQQRVGTVGNEGRTLDLVLSIERTSGPAEVWVEVKAGAPIHGDQLEAYLESKRLACLAEPSVFRELVVIDNVPPPSRFKDQISWITWQQIHDAVTPDDSAVWSELRRFLVQARLVEPPSATPEVHATTDVAKALSMALRETANWSWVGWAKGAKGEWQWATTLATEIRNNEARSGNRVVRVWAPKWFLHVDAGEFQLDERQWGVRLAVASSNVVVHGFMRRRAKAANLDPTIWAVGAEREEDTIVAAYRDSAADLTELTAWVVERVRELADAGLLVTINGDGAIDR